MKNHDPNTTEQLDPIATEQLSLFDDFTAQTNFAEKSPTISLAISSIDLDLSLQCRHSVTQTVIEEYASALQRGDTLPPIHVAQDPVDKKMRVIDGFHRLLAYEKLGRTSIPAQITVADKAKALRLAVIANATHGLPRSSADKRKGITKILLEPEYTAWTDRAIAQLCKVDHKTVSAVRVELELAKAIEPISARINQLGQMQQTSKSQKSSTAINGKTVTQKISNDDPEPVRLALPNGIIAGEIPKLATDSMPQNSETVDVFFDRLIKDQQPTTSQDLAQNNVPNLADSQTSKAYRLLRDFVDSEISITISRDRSSFKLTFSNHGERDISVDLELNADKPDGLIRQFIHMLLDDGIASDQ